MTDQTIPDVTDEERRIARDWAAFIIRTPFTSMPMEAAAARVILHAVPARPTLADMTEAERRECRWMQCEVRGDRRIITRIRDDDDHNYAVTLAPSGYTAHCLFESVTPRPDLPRLEWPGEQQPAPAAPALPDGWRLADHEKHGRVVVTNTTPDEDGHVYFVAPAPAPLGNDWHPCDPDELAYLDQEAADAVD